MPCGLELADRLGCSAEERADVYYVALVAHVDCTGAAGLFAEWAGGDDIHFQRGAQLLGAVSEPSEDLRYFLRRFADDRPLPERVWLRGRMLVGGNAQQNERRARYRFGDVKPQAIDRRVACSTSGAGGTSGRFTAGLGGLEALTRRH